MMHPWNSPKYLHPFFSYKPCWLTQIRGWNKLRYFTSIPKRNSILLTYTHQNNSFKNFGPRFFSSGSWRHIFPLLVCAPIFQAFSLCAYFPTLPYFTSIVINFSCSYSHFKSPNTNEIFKSTDQRIIWGIFHSQRLTHYNAVFLASV